MVNRRSNLRSGRRTRRPRGVSSSRRHSIDPGVRFGLRKILWCRVDETPCRDPQDPVSTGGPRVYLLRAGCEPRDRDRERVGRTGSGGMEVLLPGGATPRTGTTVLATALTQKTGPRTTTSPGRAPTTRKDTPSRVPHRLPSRPVVIDGTTPGPPCRTPDAHRFSSRTPGQGQGPSW